MRSVCVQRVRRRASLRVRYLEKLQPCPDGFICGDSLLFVVRGAVYRLVDLLYQGTEREGGTEASRSEMRIELFIDLLTCFARAVGEMAIDLEGGNNSGRRETRHANEEMGSVEVHRQHRAPSYRLCVKSTRLLAWLLPDQAQIVDCTLVWGG